MQNLHLAFPTHSFAYVLQMQNESEQLYVWT